MKIWMNGEMRDRQQAAVNVFDHGVLYGDGCFEGIRVYDGEIFQCRAHLERLFRSAQLLRMPVAYNREELTEAMQQCIAANGITDGYIRLVVTRGEGLLGLNPFNCTNSMVFIIADTITLYPHEMYEQGMPVIVARTRRSSPSMLPPRVKSCNYLNNIMAKIECIDAGVPEALMCNADGHIAEGTGDNIFIVRDGCLITPPPEAGILLGITRAVVMLLAKRLGMEVREEVFTPEELMKAEECFLTGSAAEVIPVTTVGGKPLGSGTVGPVAKKLQQAFRDFIRSGEQIDYQDPEQ